MKEIVEGTFSLFLGLLGLVHPVSFSGGINRDGAIAAVYFGETVAFWSYSNSQEAMNSLKSFGNKIDTFSPPWYRFDENGMLLGKGHDQELLEPLVSGTKIMPLVTNYDPVIQSGSRIIAASVLNQSVTQRAITNTEALVDKHNYDGIVLDLENVDSKDRDKLSGFAQQLYQMLQKNNKLLYIAVPAKTVEDVRHSWSGAFDYAMLGKYSDALIVMAYNEHWANGEPGPIESLGYLKKVLAYVDQTVPKTKVIVGFNTYGLKWIPGEITKTISYSDSLSLLKDNNCKSLEMVPGAKGYECGKSIIWIDDYVSMQEKMDFVNALDYRGMSFWSLGREDDQIWNLID